MLWQYRLTTPRLLCVPPGVEQISKWMGDNAGQASHCWRGKLHTTRKAGVERTLWDWTGIRDISMISCLAEYEQRWIDTEVRERMYSTSVGWYICIHFLALFTDGT